MVSLLARFYEIQDGVILVDGVNVQDMDIESYRNHLGIVLQEPYLFSGTIIQNIMEANPTSSEEALERVITLTYLHEFIVTCPLPYPSVLIQMFENGAPASVLVRGNW